MFPQFLIIFEFRFSFYLLVLFLNLSLGLGSTYLICSRLRTLARSCVIQLPPWPAQRRAAGHVHCPCPPLATRAPTSSDCLALHTQMFCLGYTQPRVHRPSHERWLLIRPPLPFFLHLPTLKRLTPTAEALHGVLLCSRMPFLRARHALWFGLLLVARQSSRH